ncbi:ATP-binding protein [Streptomyces sp. NPDC002994]|uniref:ATP-binding protein n=1 Tax=Streptomyces sp. NPDC002994 TaxID=3154441 RepID=UPI0033ABFD09
MIPTTHLHVELLAIPKAVPELRRAVRQHLGGPCADVQLCVSELLTNVITHVGEGTPVTLRVSETRDRRTTRVEVTDPDPRALPVHLLAVDDAESGRGMALLAAVALRWGIRQGADSKTVWCELSSVGDRPEW